MTRLWVRNVSTWLAHYQSHLIGVSLLGLVAGFYLGHGPGTLVLVLADALLYATIMAVLKVDLPPHPDRPPARAVPAQRPGRQHLPIVAAVLGGVPTFVLVYLDLVDTLVAIVYGSLVFVAVAMVAYRLHRRYQPRCRYCRRRGIPNETPPEPHPQERITMLPNVGPDVPDISSDTSSTATVRFDVHVDGDGGEKEIFEARTITTGNVYRAAETLVSAVTANATRWVNGQADRWRRQPGGGGAVTLSASVTVGSVEHRVNQGVSINGPIAPAVQALVAACSGDLKEWLRDKRWDAVESGEPSAD